MPKVVILHDGREVVIDEFKITHSEYSKILKRETTDAEDEVIFGKACNLTAEEVAALPEKDWRLLTHEVFKAITTPDPI